MLAWHEHLPAEDVPPQWMWAMPEELEKHFEKLKIKRKQGHSADEDDEEWAPGQTIQNEYAKGRGRG